MKDMNKLYEYRGYQFNIKVELNHEKLDCHKITISHLGSHNWDSNCYCNTSSLEANIAELESTARNKVDTLFNPQPEVVKILTDLGFK